MQVEVVLNLLGEASGSDMRVAFLSDYINTTHMCGVPEVPSTTGLQRTVTRGAKVRGVDNQRQPNGTALSTAAPKDKNHELRNNEAPQPNWPVRGRNP